MYQADKRMHGQKSTEPDSQLRLLLKPDAEIGWSGTIPTNSKIKSSEGIELIGAISVTRIG